MPRAGLAGTGLGPRDGRGVAQPAAAEHPATGPGAGEGAGCGLERGRLCVF